MEYRKRNMRTRKYTARAFMVLVVFFTLSVSNSVYAELPSHKQGELSNCFFKIGGKGVNFTAYQPGGGDGKLCGKLPQTRGVTYFSLDMTSRSQRNQLINVKLSPLVKADDKLLTATDPTLSFEVVTPPSGVVTFNHDFKGSAGKYRLEVFNRDDNTQGNFDFEVGSKEFKWGGKFGQMVAFGVFGVLALAWLIHITFFRKKKKA